MLNRSTGSSVSTNSQLMKNNIRIAIYLLILLTTTLIPSSKLHQKPYVAILPVAAPTLTQLAPRHMDSVGSFVLATQIVVPAPIAPTIAQPTTSITNCGDNSAATYIYTKESGCNTQATNAEGCYGLGQDCSGTVLNTCGASYVCQNTYFNNYALTRYGSWSNAQAFWEANNWW